MGAKLNESIRAVFWLGATGATLVYTIIKPDNTVDSTGNMTENPNKANEYYKDFTPNVQGVWRVIGVCALQVFEGELIYHVGMGQEKSTEDKIDALNDLSAAEVEAECIDALESFILDALIAVASPGGIPVADSYLDYIMNIDVGQTFARATDSLEAIGGVVAAIASDVVDTKEGKVQTFKTTIDLHQAAGTYDVATGTTQDVLIESIVFSPRDDISNDVTGITAVTFQTDTVTETEFIDNVLGAIANLTQEAQISWWGATLLKATDKIQFTIEGGTATADPSTCDVIIKYRAIVDGGLLA